MRSYKRLGAEAAIGFGGLELVVEGLEGILDARLELGYAFDLYRELLDCVRESGYIFIDAGGGGGIYILGDVVAVLAKILGGFVVVFGFFLFAVVVVFVFEACAFGGGGLDIGVFGKHLFGEVFGDFFGR